MLFGRTLFAGALVAGYVTATGVGAVASAHASAAASVVYNSKGHASVSAAVEAQGLRTVLPVANVASASASVQGKALAEFFLSGSALATAIAQARATAEFFGQASVQAKATTTGVVYKRVRMRTQPPAKAYAEGDADPQIYFLARGRTAYLRAHAVGTTDHVGRGVAQASATLSGQAEKAIGVRQDAPAFAYAEASAVTIAGAVGAGVATANGWADAAVTRMGVRQFEVFGTAYAKALCKSLTVSVYQPQVARCSAVLAANPIHIKGCKGSATARATSSGEGYLVQTGVVGAPAKVVAAATATASKRSQAVGNAVGVASIKGRASTSFNGKGYAKASASIQLSRIALAVRASAMANANTMGKGVRVLRAKGMADSVATAFGYNQVNDVVKAPLGRTVLVLKDQRLIVVEASPRIILVEA